MEEILRFSSTSVLLPLSKAYVAMTHNRLVAPPQSSLVMPFYPQTASSSTPHRKGCPVNTTVAYDHCKSHAHWVDTNLLAKLARDVPKCGRNIGEDCIDDICHLAKSGKVFLNRGECRTYTGNAVSNTADLYKALGIPESNLMYFDQCLPDGSRKQNDTLRMCFEHLYGRPLHNQPKGGDMPISTDFPSQSVFDQTPYVTSYDVGFSSIGYLFVPSACKPNGITKCGLQVRFHGCCGSTPPDPESMALAEAHNFVLMMPNVRGLLFTFEFYGNNATETCNYGTPMAGNCKEILRGCWDGYGKLSRKLCSAKCPTYDQRMADGKARRFQ